MTNFLIFQVHSNANDSHGLLTLLDGLLTFLSNLSQQSPPAIFAAVLPGIAALENSHPIWVHFPIALLASFFLLDVVASWRKHLSARQLASLLLYAGTVSAFFTVLVGFMAANSVAHSEEVHGIMERHEFFGVTTLGLASVLSIWRWLKKSSLQDDSNSLFLLLSALMCLSLGLGADLGGLMVYRYGVAVKAALPAMQSIEQSHHHSH